MQQNNIDQPPSLSQLLRESYLAEARAQQRHSEMSRSDSSSSRRLVYGSLKGKTEDSVGHDEPQFPDLSAFLSQEELDKSVNLARQAIGHEPREERAEVKAPVAPSAALSVAPSDILSTTSFAASSPAPIAVPSTTSCTQPAPEIKELPPTHTTFSAEAKMHKASTPQDSMIRNNRASSEGSNDFGRSARHAPYGMETQSKKEFLNKAADFIEELSSLFKANSSKRIRPRACKTHRSRTPKQSQNDGTVYPLSPDERERPVMPLELEAESSNPAVGYQPEARLDSGIGHEEFQDCRITEEQQYGSASQEEVEEEAESSALTETPYSAEPVCEPPRFIQKLKSREVPEGSKVQLDCIVRGRPVPEVRWFCEGKELENSPDIQIITNGELHSVIIAEAFEEDTGRYSCFASNFYGTDSTSAEIYIEGASSSDSEGEQHFEHVAQLQRTATNPAPVLPPATSPAVSTGAEDSLTPQTEAAAEEPAQELSPQPPSQAAPAPPLPVQTSAAVPPAPELSQAPVVSALLPIQEETTLVFPASPPGDTEAQEVSTPVPVTSITQPVQATSLPLNSVSSAPSVQVAPAQINLSENQISSHSYLQGLDGQPFMAAPVFTKSLQDLLALEGQLVVLECRVKGVPSPRVEWYREGTIIDDSPDFRILQKKPRSPAESEEICTLVIAEVFPEDTGMFTCTASNKYGTVSSIAALRVKGKGNNSNHLKPVSSSMLEPGQIQQPSPPDLTALTVKPQQEVTVTNSIKPHSSTIRLDPLVSSTLRLDPVNTSTLRLDPNSSSMLRPDPISTSLPSLDPLSLNSNSHLGSYSTSTPRLDPVYLSSQHPDLPGSNGAHPDPHSGGEVPSYLKPFSASSVAEPPNSGLKTEQEVSKPLPPSPDLATATSLKVKGTPNHHNDTPTVVPLPDPPANSCLKTGVLVNHKEPRVGLRVHFKLPEDEEDEPSDASSYEDTALALASKEPPPVLAKPKLDPAQLQLLHNQVLMEQQQETEPPSQIQIQTQSQIQSQVQSSPEVAVWSPRMHREPQPPPFQPYANTAKPQQTSHPAPPMTTAPPAPSLSSTPAPFLNTTSSPQLNTSPAPPFSSYLSSPHLKSAPPVTSPPAAPILQPTTAPASLLNMASVTQMNTIHSSHLNLSPAALSSSHLSRPPAPQLSSVSTDYLSSTSSFQDITSPTPMLRTTHASLMNLTPTSQSFNYARPKEFIAAQTLSPVRSPSPTESPVPLLNELAAELNSSTASSPTFPPFSPPPRIFPTRVLKSPTSPPALVSSPTPLSSSFLNSVFAVRAQSPPQASSPTSSSSTPSPIQNPVAFLSSVLPSLPSVPLTNSMGLPKGAPPGRPQSILKKLPKSRLSSSEDIRESKEILLHDIEKKLRFKDDTTYFGQQQKLSNEGKTASRPLGPNIPATVFNYDEEYRVSSFEQRLMSEIEFRLERTPVEESDEEVQHDEIPTGKCIAPIFDKKLKNYRAVEGVPVTFSCKVVGIPFPKVYWFKDGKQILRKNEHYQKIREGDGTCALHIESVTNDDDGNFTIMAANPQGRISCSGHLVVQTGPPRNRMTPIHSQRVRARIQEVESEQTQERFFRPHFLQAPGDMLAHEGRMCRLDCKVSGLPNPELMWLVNGRPIYPDLYHKMLVRENGVHSLVIDPVTQKDAGTYTCIASNKAGQSSFCLELKVVEKEMKQPPHFVEKLQNTGIPEGTPVRLECRVLGLPHPVIFWKKDNDSIPKTKDRISMHQDATGYVCLLIQPTKKEDAGWYTVSAKNEAGIISCTARLDIYAQWHQSIPAPMKATRTGSRYAALTGQGLDIKSAFPTSENSPILFSSSPPEATLESEEL